MWITSSCGTVSSAKDLQYIMGHSNIAMTLNYYAHADYASAKAAMDKLAA